MGRPCGKLLGSLALLLVLLTTARVSVVHGQNTTLSPCLQAVLGALGIDARIQRITSGATFNQTSLRLVDATLSTCARASFCKGSGQVLVTRLPSWHNGLLEIWLQDALRDQRFLLPDIIYSQALPPMVTLANASNFASPDPLSSSGAVVSTDMSGIPARVAAEAMADFSTTTENACVNLAQPVGPLHPRMYLLMFYRQDIVSALHAAGYSTLPGPPNDWGELLHLLQSLQDARREQQQQQQLTEASGIDSNATLPAGGRNASGLPQLPRYGLCVTPLPHCGRAGDLLSAIAASASQTAGTAQGYLFDTWQPLDVAAARVAGAGWRYAAGMLRALMAHNAPPADAGRCEAVSELFIDGSCMVTFEWDAVLPYLKGLPGALGVAPLPGSRFVAPPRGPRVAAAPDTSDTLQPCDRDLCGLSVGHDTLYRSGHATESITWNGTLYGNGSAPAGLQAAWAHVQSVALTEAAGLQGPEQLAREQQVPLVNRAPYSSVFSSRSRISNVDDSALGFAVTEYDKAVRVVALEFRRLRQRMLASLRLSVLAADGNTTSVAVNSTALFSDAVLGPTYSCAALVGAPWWQAARVDASWNVSELAALGLEADGARSYLSALYHALHSPNAAPEVLAPVSTNWFRWALGEAGAALAAPETAVPEPPARRRVVEASTTPTEAQQGSQLLHMLDYELSESDVRYVDGVVHRLAEAFELIVALAGGNAVRQFYDESIGAHVNSQTSATGGGGSSGLSKAGLAVAIALPIGVTLLLVLMCAACCRLPSSSLPFCGRVRAPYVSPDTTLLITDVQNSTVLWEALPVSVMDAALLTHHACVRRVLSAHGGYESGTEGDSFILAFYSPASAVAFAAHMQLALLEEDWPMELLAHPDGCVVLVEPRDKEQHCSLSTHNHAPTPRNALLGSPFGSGRRSVTDMLSLPASFISARLSNNSSRRRRKSAISDALSRTTTTSAPSGVLPPCPESGVVGGLTWEAMQHASSSLPLAPAKMQFTTNTISSSATPVYGNASASLAAASVTGVAGSVQSDPCDASRGPFDSQSTTRYPQITPGPFAPVQVSQPGAVSPPVVQGAAGMSADQLGAESLPVGTANGGPRGPGPDSSPRPGKFLALPWNTSSSGMDSPGAARRPRSGAGSGLLPSRRKEGGGVFPPPKLLLGASVQEMADEGSPVGDGNTYRPGRVCTWLEALAASHPVVQGVGLPLDLPAWGKGKATHAGRLSDGRIVAFRGLRVRCGLHCGISDPRSIRFNRVSASYQYTGAFAEATRLVGDSAVGGMVVMSSDVFMRLRNVEGATGAKGFAPPPATARALADVTILYAGHHMLKDEPEPAAAAGSPLPPASSVLSASGDGPGGFTGSGTRKSATGFDPVPRNAAEAVLAVEEEGEEEGPSSVSLSTAVGPSPAHSTPNASAQNTPQHAGQLPPSPFARSMDAVHNAGRRSSSLLRATLAGGLLAPSRLATASTVGTDSTRDTPRRWPDVDAQVHSADCVSVDSSATAVSGSVPSAILPGHPPKLGEDGVEEEAQLCQRQALGTGPRPGPLGESREEHATSPGSAAGPLSDSYQVPTPSAAAAPPLIGEEHVAVTLDPPSPGAADQPAQEVGTGASPAGLPHSTLQRQGGPSGDGSNASVRDSRSATPMRPMNLAVPSGASRHPHLPKRVPLPTPGSRPTRAAPSTPTNALALSPSRPPFASFASLLRAPGPSFHLSLGSLRRPSDSHPHSAASTLNAPEPPLPQALFQAVPTALLCRLALCAPLRSKRVLQLGSLAAPTGCITIAFMKVVGAATLLAELPRPAGRALDRFQRVAGGLLGAAPGYLVEGGEGLVLAAFGSPAAAVGWALECMEAMRQEEWEPELLAHELCEEVISFGANGGLVEPAIRQGSGRVNSTRAAVVAAVVQQTPQSPLVPGRFGGEERQGQLAGADAGVAGSVKAGVSSAVAATPRPELVATRSYALQRQGTALYRGLRIKVGIDVGFAAHSLTDASGRLSYRGKVMNRAARIAGVASPGQVLCSGAVWEAAAEGGEGLLQGVTGVSLGCMKLKGISTPVEVMQCIRGAEGASEGVLGVA